MADFELAPGEAASIALNSYFALKDWAIKRPVAGTESRGKRNDRVRGSGNTNGVYPKSRSVGAGFPSASMDTIFTGEPFGFVLISSAARVPSWAGTTSPPTFALPTPVSARPATSPGDRRPSGESRVTQAAPCGSRPADDVAVGHQRRLHAHTPPDAACSVVPGGTNA